MLLKGILLILIGISGIVVTIAWIIKSFNKDNKSNSKFYNTIQKDYCASEISNDINHKELHNNIEPIRLDFEKGEIESTVLLDDSVIDKQIDETILLEDEESK